MNQLLIDLWPYLISGLLVGIAGWMTSLVKGEHKIFSKQAVLEERIHKMEGELLRLDKRLDHKAEQFDQLQNEIAGFRGDLAEIKGDIKTLAGELKTSLGFLKKDLNLDIDDK